MVVDLPSSDGKLVVEELGDRAAFAPADVTDEDQVLAAIEVAKGLGDFAITVNRAGIGNAIRVVGKDGSPFPLSDFTKVVDVNLVGTFNVTRLAAAAMIASTPIDGEERGVIVNTASVAAFDGQVGQTAYSASKGGVVGMTLPMARDLAQHKIAWSLLLPASS